MIPRQKILVRTMMLVLILIGNAVFLYFNAFRCFNFFDMSGFLDGGWRILCGQKPYVDFIYTTGPMHLYMNAFFFYLSGGVGKLAVWLHLVVVHSLIILTTYWMVKDKLPLWSSFLVTLVSATCFYWSVSHPWYDQSAHLWGILAVGLLVGRRPFVSPQSAAVLGFCCGVLCVLSLMAKTNIGLAYLAAFFGIFLIGEFPLKALMGYFGGIVAALGLIFTLLISPSHYFDQAILSYGRHKSGRLGELLRPSLWFLNYYWINAVIAVGISTVNWRRNRIIWPVFIGIFFVAIFAIGTGNMIRSANIPLWGIVTALTLIILHNLECDYALRHKKILWYAANGFVHLFCILLVVVGIKRGINLETWSYMGSAAEGNYAIKADRLKGWLCDKNQGEVFDMMVDFIAQNIPPDDSFLVLGDMTILYAATGRESFKGVPFLLEAGELPVPGKQAEEVRNNILNNFPDWIFWNVQGPTYGGNILKYLNIHEEVLADYRPVKQWQYYVLLRRIK